jgi:hypothetical protein
MDSDKDIIVLPMGTFRKDPNDKFRWIEVPRDDGFKNWLFRAWANSPVDFTQKN